MEPKIMNFGMSCNLENNFVSHLCINSNLSVSLELVVFISWMYFHDFDPFPFGGFFKSLRSLLFSSGFGPWPSHYLGVYKWTNYRLTCTFEKNEKYINTMMTDKSNLQVITLPNRTLSLQDCRRMLFYVIKWLLYKEYITLFRECLYLGSMLL